MEPKMQAKTPEANKKYLKIEVNNYQVELTYDKEILHISATDRLLEKWFTGDFKDADLPEHYKFLYGGCELILEAISEWQQCKNPILMSDVGQLCFKYKATLYKRQSEFELKFQLEEAQVTEVTKLRMKISALEDMINSEGCTRLNLTVDKSAGYHSSFTYENSVIHSNKTPSRWLPVILGKMLDSCVYFDIECLQKPVSLMVGVVAQAYRSTQNCNGNASMWIYFSSSPTVYFYSMGSAYSLPLQYPQQGDTIRTRYYHCDSVSWQLIRKNGKRIKLGRLPIPHANFNSKFYPSVMSYTANQRYRLI